MDTSDRNETRPVAWPAKDVDWEPDLAPVGRLGDRAGQAVPAGPALGDDERARHTHRFATVVHLTTAPGDAGHDPKPHRC
jgi:hypothetical protein